MGKIFEVAKNLPIKDVNGRELAKLSPYGDFLRKFWAELC